MMRAMSTFWTISGQYRHDLVKHFVKVVRLHRVAQHRVAHQQSIGNVSAARGKFRGNALLNEQVSDVIKADPIHFLYRLKGLAVTTAPVTNGLLDTGKGWRSGSTRQRNKGAKPVYGTTTARAQPADNIGRHPAVPLLQHRLQQCRSAGKMPVKTALGHAKLFAKNVNSDATHIFVHENASRNVNPIALVERSFLEPLRRFPFAFLLHLPVRSIARITHAVRPFQVAKGITSFGYQMPACMSL